MGDPRGGKRTPIDIVEEYLHKDFNEAVRWLAQKLGLDPQEYLPPPKIITPPPPKIITPPGKKEGYMAGKTKLACNVGNVLLALKQEPELMNAFGFDEMQRTEMVLRPLFGDEPDFKPRPVTDTDVCAVQSWLQWFGFRRLGKDATHDAINKHAREHAYHPVRGYLNALRWGGKPRLATWLHVYLGAEQNEYT